MGAQNCIESCVEACKQLKFTCFYFLGQSLVCGIKKHVEDGRKFAEVCFFVEFIN